MVGYSPEGKGLVAALYLGRKDGRNLTFVGKVGTGWSMKQSAELRMKLEVLEVERSPLVVPGRVPKARWVRPTMNVDVEYRAITAAGVLRHSVRKGVANVAPK